MVSIVVNLATGDTVWSTLSPREALIDAVRQCGDHRYDWWSADYGDLPILETPDTWFCGDWSVLKSPDRATWRGI